MSKHVLSVSGVPIIQHGLTYTSGHVCHSSLLMKRVSDMDLINLSKRQKQIKIKHSSVKPKEESDSTEMWAGIKPRMLNSDNLLLRNYPRTF